MLVKTIISLLFSTLGRILFVPLIIAFVLVGTGQIDTVIDGAGQFQQAIEQLNSISDKLGEVSNG